MQNNVWEKVFYFIELFLRAAVSNWYFLVVVVVIDNRNDQLFTYLLQVAYLIVVISKMVGLYYEDRRYGE